MNNHDYSKPLIKSTRMIKSTRIAVTLCVLAALGGRAALAQATALTDLSQLGAFTFTTAPYPKGTPRPLDPQTGIVPSSFFVAAGSNNLTFTATNGTPAAGFVSFADNLEGPQFAPGTVVEETNFKDSNGSSTPTGPLRIQFQTGVSGFGLYAQDFAYDTENFTLNVFADSNATISLGSFTFGPTDNSASTSTGNAAFVGAQSNLGPLIKSATLSSFSSAGTGPSNNDFYFGPTTIKAPVPEASTVFSFGMGVLLFAGLALGAHKRRVADPSQASG